MRTGTEQVVLSNAVQNQVYYIGVKAEDQMAAEFSFFGVFSLLPFGDEDGNVPCFNVPQTILRYGTLTPEYARQWRRSEYGVSIALGLRGTF